MNDPFEPAQFSRVCDHRVEEWSPRREVRLARPMGFGLIAALPFVVCGLLAGPVYFVMDRGTGEPLVGRLFSAGGIGLFGIIVGALALAPLIEGVPRQLVLDWSARTLTISGWFHRRTIPFVDLAAVELRCIRNRGTGKSSRVDYYFCEIHACFKNAAAAGGPSVELVETKIFDDPETPRRPSLPMVGELAEALGVPLRVIEYK